MRSIRRRYLSELECANRDTYMYFRLFPPPAYTSHKSNSYVWLSCSTDAYVEVLDGSRVPPETYEWARKMAIDALEIDEADDDATPASALEEILESPEKLRELDLDAFAAELERQVTLL